MRKAKETKKELKKETRKEKKKKQKSFFSDFGENSPLAASWNRVDIFECFCPRSNQFYLRYRGYEFRKTFRFYTSKFRSSYQRGVFAYLRVYTNGSP